MGAYAILKIASKTIDYLTTKSTRSILFIKKIGNLRNRYLNLTRERKGYINNIE